MFEDLVKMAAFGYVGSKMSQEMSKRMDERKKEQAETLQQLKNFAFVVYDGKAPYAAAFNLCRHIQSMGVDAKLKDADDYYEGYPGKVIIIGHHDLTKKQLAAVGALHNSNGMMLGYTQDKCVLRVSRSALGKGKKGRKKFEEYYNTRILSYKELAASYNVPMQFGSRDETRKSQYDLIWLVFATHWLYGFLGKTSELGQGAGIDMAQQAANDLIQKVTADKDKVYTLEELLLTTRRIDVEENAEKNRENARLSVKTPTKNVEKVAYSGTHHKKTEYRNHKPRSN